MNKHHSNEQRQYTQNHDIITIVKCGILHLITNTKLILNY